ncbi:ATP-binding cassette sub-family C member 4 isoform X3 [Leptinotarsa decemlineata]|uniref:ATP-binding cassette sub-family C member 4 isoform X3 n=1 Tax=Leptinotarsa decemlineata TaxID=7539 RepID=UPI003D30511A
MDNVNQLKLDNPRVTANFFSKLFFGWMIALIAKTTKGKLNILDLYKTLDEDKSKLLGDILENNWNNEMTNANLKGRSPSFMRALYKTFFVPYMILGIPFFLQIVIFRCLQTVVLAHLIYLFRETSEENAVMDMYIFSLLLIGFGFLISLTCQHTNHNMALIGMRVRVATSSLVYRKIMRLSRESLSGTAAGQVVNLLSNDVNRFDSVALYLHVIWAIPFQIALLTYFLWQQVQLSCLVGIISTIFVSLPIQGYIGKECGKLRQLIAEKTDKRMKLMNSLVSGIQVIKMYAWEKSFEKVVNAARASEINDIMRTSYRRAILLSFMVYIQKIALFVTVTCYFLLGNVITAEKMFSMAQFFNILRNSTSFLFPYAVSNGSEALTSVKRLEMFLLLDEQQTIRNEINEGEEVTLTNVSACWVPKNFTLTNITLRIPPGSLCAVIGPVGSGKSSFLQLLLGELPVESGIICIEDGISYSSQEPWLFSSTIRNNILFGQAYDELYYKKIVRVCCLERDFDQFPNGDMTIVGDRGVILSGGQKARVNLARAIYRKANIYLMDDPLSAVDTHVAKHLFEKCIVDHLQGKTRVLVTHQLQHLKKADLIFVINQGIIKAQGTLEELKCSGVDFTEMLVDKRSPNESDLNYVGTEIVIPNEKGESQTVMKEVISAHRKIWTKEDIRDIGKVSPFKEYFKSAESKCLVVLFIVWIVLSQAFCTLADYWTSFWTQQEETRHSLREVNSNHLAYQPYENDSWSFAYSYSTTDYPAISKNATSVFFDYIEFKDTLFTLIKTDYSMIIYGILIVGTIVFTITRNMMYFKISMIASEKLHSKILHVLLKAPMRFFDTNSNGSILNRFSKDMGAVDEIFPGALCHSFQIGLILIGMLVNVIVSNTVMVVVIIIFGFIFWKMAQWYISTAAAVKNLETTAKSPVFSHISSTLDGMTTIRASKVEELLIHEFDEHQDIHTSAFYLTLSCSFCFGLWIDLICSVFTACVTFSSVLIHTSTSLPNSWPTDGKIKFNNVSLKYVENDPPVLNDLNFTVESGEKVGIVGRTGAGKSSLIVALFRLAPTEGSIFIDEVDTKKIGLSDLRKKISIIPQDPVLFSAPLRYNLDPFDEFEDTELWKVLEQVELKDVVDSLDFMVTEGGNNFSLGQKQLICLARAILRNNKILVLDEATANVDQRTDLLIQKTIREKFSNCTVLTIAHRLNTIMDTDKVIVISFGKILEFDHPHQLLQIPNGHFLGMVQETGPMVSSQLKNIAFDAYKNQKKTIPKHNILRNMS